MFDNISGMKKRSKNLYVISNTTFQLFICFHFLFCFHDYLHLCLLDINCKVTVSRVMHKRVHLLKQKPYFSRAKIYSFLVDA